jgi:hypothetical protein
MSLQDQRRYQEALYEATKDDPEAGISIEDLEGRLGREAGDSRTPDCLNELHAAGLIELDSSRVWITLKGIWALGKGPRPPTPHLGGS